MKRKIFLFLFFIFFFLQQSFAESIQLFGLIGDLKLQNGKILHDCKIGYRTFGLLNSEKSNVILVPTWFAGVSKDVISLLGADKLIDTTRYFIIVVDALGNGISTSPTNYSHEIPFPEITVRDMVESEYKLVKNILSINHLLAVIGGSMGSMQAFEFVVAYPDFMDKAIPYSASPKITSNEKIIFSLMKEIITTGKKYGESENEILKKLNIIIQLLARTPANVNKNYPRDKFTELQKKFERTSPIFTTACYLAQIDAMFTHDITRNFNSSFEETAKHIKAKLFIIVSQTDLLLNPQPALDFAVAANSKTLLLKNDCGHLAVGCEMDLCRTEIQKFLEEK
ncbi:MAG: alpha/beta fold hydrolase [Ignavibacteriaceae bacterium]|nr:alpha/beta fold hydrolase [Ignavibacteriaceae bacterium]